MRAKDWAATPLGAPETWSPSIRTAVSLCLNSRFPILLWLGPELRIVYNDAYIPFLGEAKHPAMLGAPGCEAWSEIWDAVAPMHAEAQAGRATWAQDFQTFIARRLPSEEVYVTFSYSPIFGEDGRTVEGVFCACTETTDRVVGERRLSTLHGLGLRALQQRTAETAAREAAQILETNPADVPFAAVYLCDKSGRTVRRVAGAGLPEEARAFPAAQPLSGKNADSPWPFTAAMQRRGGVEVGDLPARIGTLTAPLWPEDLVQRALVLPLPGRDHGRPVGFLVIGISPRRVLDADYRAFIDLTAEHVGIAILGARAFEDERRRAETLVDLDRAKTAFFSNVSHEFRTPLTLILGALEELLAKPDDALPSDGRGLAMVARRNGLRLLRLVNTLLDFSCIEAGRAQASYRPTDLVGFTAELAANFRSACDRAGLRLDVICDPLPQPVWVDRDMWEKVILNLLSNAFKFTFKGGITIQLAVVSGQRAELRISDTGTGIAAADLPNIFQRFHRIEGQRSRSHEGSGIGLALVQEMVHLHGGTIVVASEPGQGTTFTVSLPFGTAHLPAERVVSSQGPAIAATSAPAYAEEALRWLPTEVHPEVAEPSLRHHGRAEAVSATPVAEQATILVADDNADMRDYLARLLSAKGWAVETVADGAAALAAARHHRPCLVLADVMMPGLGGLELAAALRQEPGFAEVPVILLSARAGEEARVDGLGTGADDYLVKPFAARELLARVASHLELARLRREATARVQRSEARLQAAVELVGLSPYSWNPATGALEWNDRLRAMWGLPPGAPVDADIFLAGIHPDDRARVEAAIAACTDPAGNGVYHLEYRVVGIGDGVERWVSTHGRTAFKDGRPVSFTGAALEVTERKRSEAALRASEARFREFAEHSASVLWITDLEGLWIEYLSPAFETVWGRPAGPMPQRNALWTESIHPDDRAHALAAMERVRRGEVATAQYRIRRPTGGERWIRDTLFPIRDEQGRPLRLGGIAQDITGPGHTRIYVVGAEEASRQRLALLLGRAGYEVQPFNTARAFLDAAPALMPGCVVLDFAASGDWGPLVVRELKARRIGLPVIAVGESRGDVGTAVEALKAGAVDWLEVPYGDDAMLAAVASVLARAIEAAEGDQAAELARARIAALSGRGREVLEGLLAGGTNKTIARELGLSPRTVEIHRAHVMEILGARSLADLVLLATAAGLQPRI